MTFEDAAKVGSTHLAMWVPNIGFGLAGGGGHAGVGGMKGASLRLITEV